MSLEDKVDFLKGKLNLELSEQSDTKVLYTLKTKKNEETETETEMEWGNFKERENIEKIWNLYERLAAIKCN